MEISIPYFILGMVIMTISIMVGNSFCGWIKSKRTKPITVRMSDHHALVLVIKLLE